ncbi:MAG: hypothetical protein ACTSU5_14430 [Promethearchaeota archaeon]
MKVNPPCKRFVIFSGGGGLVFRSQLVEVPAGRTTLEVGEVPASFDPNTTSVEVSRVDGGVVDLAQVDVRRPDKRIMDMFLDRERSASDSIIQSSTDLRGANREKIIQICESAYYRRYEDMLGTISVTVDAKEPAKFTLQVKYFVEDSRIKWRPSVHVSLKPDGKHADVEFHIQVLNNTDFNFENVEVQFAEFEMEREVGEEGYLANISAEQGVQTKMPSTNLLKNVRRLNKFIK